MYKKFIFNNLKLFITGILICVFRKRNFFLQEKKEKGSVNILQKSIFGTNFLHCSRK